MAAGAGQRGTRQGGLRVTGECRLFSKAGVQRRRELEKKKRGLTEKGAQAVLVQAHLSQGLGSRAPGGTENPGVGPSAEPSPLPGPGEEGAPDSPVDTELQAPHARGHPGVAPAAAPHPTETGPPASALGPPGPGRSGAAAHPLSDRPPPPPHPPGQPPARPLPHLSFKTCQLVLGFASSNSRLLFLSRLTEVRGVLWEMESRLGGGGW